MENDICAAINGKRICHFVYHLELSTVEPHVLGFYQERLTLCAYQRNGPTPGWRNFNVDQITGLAVTSIEFHRARAGYNPTDTLLKRVICRL